MSGALTQGGFTPERPEHRACRERTVGERAGAVWAVERRAVQYAIPAGAWDKEAIEAIQAAYWPITEGAVKAVTIKYWSGETLLERHTHPSYSLPWGWRYGAPVEATHLSIHTAEG